MIRCGDALEQLRTLPDGSAHVCVTSPPFWGLRDYGVTGQIGLERTPEEYVERVVAVFREVARVLRPDGTLWLNLGSCYAGSGKSSGSAWQDPEQLEKSGKQRTNVGANIPGYRVTNADEPYALRDDLTVDEIAYVLTELGAHIRQRNEVAEPLLAVHVDP